MSLALASSISVLGSYASRGSVLEKLVLGLGHGFFFVSLASSLVSSTSCLAVMRASHFSVVMKREFSKKSKLSVIETVFVPILTYGHESWVMTERVRSQVQASEMSFLRRIEGVTRFNKERSFEIRKSLNLKPLLPRIERSQLRWFSDVSRLP